jgi:hypothetical protein
MWFCHILFAAGDHVIAQIPKNESENKVWKVTSQDFSVTTDNQMTIFF